MKKTIFMETTKKSPEQTVSEIQRLLAVHGAKRVSTDYDDNGFLDKVSFYLFFGGSMVEFRLPCKHQPLWKYAQEGNTKYIKDEIQARRVAWRQIYRWIEAQLALVEMEMVQIQEVFLPYAMSNNGQSLFELVENNSMKLLSGGEE